MTDRFFLRSKFQYYKMPLLIRTPESEDSRDFPVQRQTSQVTVAGNYILFFHRRK